MRRSRPRTGYARPARDPRARPHGRAHAGPGRRPPISGAARAEGRAAARASTGEQKALLIGLVMAHAHLVAKLAGMAPLMLLDEVAAHLDPFRRQALFDDARARQPGLHDRRRPGRIRWSCRPGRALRGHAGTRDPPPRRRSGSCLKQTIGSSPVSRPVCRSPRQTPQPAPRHRSGRSPARSASCCERGQSGRRD